MVAYTFYESDVRVLQYASALSKRGDTVDVFALRRDGGQPKFEALGNVNIFRIQSRTVNEKGVLTYAKRILHFLLRSMWILHQKHRERPYDVVHVHNVPDFLVFSALSLKLTKVPVILDIHDLLPEFYMSKFKISDKSFLFRLLKLVERSSAAFATHVIVANHLWRDRFVQRSASPQKCSVIRNYPDLDVFAGQSAQVKPANAKPFLLLYPGSLNSHQGVDVAVRAFAIIADRIPEAEFHIYGEGPAKPSLIQLAKGLGMQDRVTFHEPLPSSEIAQVMATASLAIEPKRKTSAFGNEALSTKILEFMALGVPLIASKTKIHAHYYDDSLISYYENDDESALAECIIRMRFDPELSAGYAHRAAIYASRNNWQVKKVEYLKLVDTLVADQVDTPGVPYEVSAAIR
jgi:glycosyltransferase involved in cell wall biosynthesis